VLLVSHQPLVGRLSEFLTGSEAAFSPGTLVRISCSKGLGAGRGRFELSIPPTASA